MAGYGHPGVIYGTLDADNTIKHAGSNVVTRFGNQTSYSDVNVMLANFYPAGYTSYLE